MGEKQEPLTFFTPPYDPRFPNTNQTKRCYYNYVHFQRCSNKRGEDYEVCQFYKYLYTVLCPSEWVEKWDRQVAEDVFPGKIK